MKRVIGIVGAILLSNISMAESLQISGAYVRATLPGQTTASAFVTLKNLSDKTLKLTEIHTRAASSVELHSHQMVNGQMQMRKIDNFSIAPGGEAIFKPGDKHIMLLGLDNPLQENTVINVEMCFDELCSVIEMPVVSVLNEADNKPGTKHQEREHQHKQEHDHH